MDKRNKNNLITNKEYEKRIKRIDRELNKENISQGLRVKLEYAKSSILETLSKRDI